VDILIDACNVLVVVSDKLYMCAIQLFFLVNFWTSQELMASCLTINILN